MSALSSTHGIEVDRWLNGHVKLIEKESTCIAFLR